MTPTERLETAERHLKAIIQGVDPLTQAQWDALYNALVEVRCAKLKLKLQACEARAAKPAQDPVP